MLNQFMFNDFIKNMASVVRKEKASSKSRSDMAGRTGSQLVVYLHTFASSQMTHLQRIYTDPSATVDPPDSSPFSSP